MRQQVIGISVFTVNAFSFIEETSILKPEFMFHFSLNYPIEVFLQSPIETRDSQVAKLLFSPSSPSSRQNTISQANSIPPRHLAFTLAFNPPDRNPLTSSSWQSYQLYIMSVRLFSLYRQ